MVNYDTLTTEEKLAAINSVKSKINIMEVCGTHTMSISKNGLRNVLPDNVNLISGPGCPVCVTPNIYLDYIYELSLKEDIIIATYGDMIRVPGSLPSMTLENAKAKGAKVRMVYSSIDAVNIAKENPNFKVVFLGIGFETTAPATAIAISEAENMGLKNFYVLSMHKLVEPVMRAILEDKTLIIDGFICPGHVAVVIGEEGFNFLEKYECPGVIAGFEGEEVIDGVYELVRSIEAGQFEIKNVYNKLVKVSGNKVAQSIINNIFDVKDDYWRGIGLVAKSGLKLKEEYREYDIESMFPIDYSEDKKNTACQCGEVLKGKIRPNECKLFGKICTPENPIGPCMVSGEGSCAAYYRYANL